MRTHVFSSNSLYEFCFYVSLCFWWWACIMLLLIAFASFLHSCMCLLVCSSRSDREKKKDLKAAWQTQLLKNKPTVTFLCIQQKDFTMSLCRTFFVTTLIFNQNAIDHTFITKFISKRIWNFSSVPCTLFRIFCLRQRIKCVNISYQVT